MWIPHPFYFLITDLGLLLLGSTNGASTCARTAVDALSSIDNVLVFALRDAAYGTLVRACAARDAIIINLISHC